MKYNYFRPSNLELFGIHSTSLFEDERTNFLDVQTALFVLQQEMMPESQPNTINKIK